MIQANIAQYEAKSPIFTHFSVLLKYLKKIGISALFNHGG